MTTVTTKLWRNDHIKHYIESVPENETDELQSCVDMMGASLFGMSVIGVEYESVIEIVSKIWGMAEKASETMFLEEGKDGV